LNKELGQKTKLPFGFKFMAAGKMKINFP